MEGTVENKRRTKRQSGENTESTTTDNKSTVGTGEAKTARKRTNKNTATMEENTGIDNNTPTPIAVINSEEPVETKSSSRSSRSSSRSKGKNTSETTEDIKNLLLAVSGIAGMAINPIWSIREEEAESIAKPLTNILQRYNLLEKIANTSDILALATALGIVIVPRAIVHISSKKQKGELQNEQQQIRENKTNDNSIPPDTGKDVARSKPANISTVSSIKAASLEASRINR